MQQKIVSLAAPILIGIMALALGWIAHAAMPLSAQGVVMDAHAAFSSPAAPAVTGARLTYQGRLTDHNSGMPISAPVNATFKLYDSANTPIYTETRTITPTNGLFTVYLGDGIDPGLLSPILLQSASIGVKVGGDEEMTPHQALNSVVGHSENGVGVTGSSSGSAGVFGTSNSFVGVYGVSNSGEGVIGSSILNVGVSGASSFSHGVSGYSGTGYGVIGGSNFNDGVVGTSITGRGVVGSSNTVTGVNGLSNTGYGVVGTTKVITRAGVFAQGAGSSGIALNIANGGIQVAGAGVGSLTPVFIQQVVTGGGSNICTGHPHATVVNNPLTNGNASAILIVTLNYRKSDASQSNGLGPAKDIPAVFYSVSGFCGAINDNRWVIYNVNGTAMVDNTYYNVLVVIP